MGYLPKLRALVPLVELCRSNDLSNPFSAVDALSVGSVFKGFGGVQSWEVIK